jgi:uncharacterized membrane protein
MATVEHVSRSENRLTENGYAEAQRLLKMAEDLEMKCQNWERQIAGRIMMTATVSCLLLVLVVIFWGLAPLSPAISESGTLSIFAILTVVSVAGLVYLTRQRLSRMNYHLQRDQRAMYEIVGMLREIESAIAERDNLTALERAGFRIRLSRFDIGSDYYSSERR